MATSAYLGSGTVTITDSKSNTWVALTPKRAGGDSNVEAQAFYVLTSPVVGSGHTFTIVGAFASMIVYAFTQSAATTFDAENGTTVGGTTCQPGSVGTSGDVVIESTAFYADNTTITIDGSFSAVTQVNYGAGVNIGCAAAWKDVSGSVNPTFTFGSSNVAAGVCAGFVGSGGGAAFVARQNRNVMQAVNRAGTY